MTHYDTLCHLVDEDVKLVIVLVFEPNPQKGVHYWLYRMFYRFIGTYRYMPWPAHSKVWKSFEMHTVGLKVFRSKIFPVIDEVGQCTNMYIFYLFTLNTLYCFSCLLSFGLCVILECEQSKVLFSRITQNQIGSLVNLVQLTLLWQTNKVANWSVMNNL